MNFIVKNTTFPSFLDLIAPHICHGCNAIGSPLCEKCKNYIINMKHDFCPNCKNPISTNKCPHCSDLPPTYFIGERSGLLNHLLHIYKYNSNRTLANQFAELLFSRLPPIHHSAIIVPLPTTSSHIRQRGLDHTLLLAKRLGKLTHLQVQPLLLRAHNTTQVGADRATRLSQAKYAYTINPRINIEPAITYILLDDIWTTGASMKAAIEKLRQAGADQLIIALLAVSKLN